ncbi:RNA polymerase sigma factor [Novosphingobium clariflavum]|uniref:RNA polymerase sigma factor n=1 Tax=Novosphingobium clariflavum TaxID=2029884 RepID=A0ABV6S4U5_9SPHN|nr:sigma-70 family RNA polymerase sigma factor [Novosphingobium clariflavum]
MLVSIKEASGAHEPAADRRRGGDAEGREGDAEGRDWDTIRAAVLRFVRGRGARPDVAEDIAQETVTRLIDILQAEQVGSIFALAFRIADNLLVDVYRRDSRLSEEVDDDWQSEEPSLERVLDSRRAIEVFHRCLRRMPALRREVLVRRRVNQESCRAIGDDLSMSAKAVEKHITRGMVDLRKALEKAGIDLGGEA